MTSDRWFIVEVGLYELTSCEEVDPQSFRKFLWSGSFELMTASLWEGHALADAAGFPRKFVTRPFL